MPITVRPLWACLNRVALPNRMGVYLDLTGDGIHGERTYS